MVSYLTESDVSEGFNQVIDFLNGSYLKLQALVDKKKTVVTEAAIKEVLWLDDAEGVDCLPNEEIFIELARMGYEKPSTKLTFYKAFFLSQWKVVKGFSGVETPLFEGMLVGQEIEEEGDADEHVEDVTDGDDAQGDDTAAHGEVPTITQEPSIPTPTPTIPPSQPPQDIPSTSQEDEPAEVQEAVDVVTTAKLITKVVTAASAIISTDEPQVLAAIITAVPIKVAAAPSRRRKGVVIRDQESKPLKKKQQIEMNEEYARKLHAEINKDIDWDVAIDHVKLKAKEDPAVQRYQVIKRRPQTEAQARKNMMIEIKEEENTKLQSINEIPTQKAAKWRKLNKEMEDLKRHLEIVPDEDDDVYTEATPLARK
nr:hypothetical protein [Tanacetum cinerariifolium]